MNNLYDSTENTEMNSFKNEFISVNKLTKIYSSASVEVKALNEVSFSINEGEFVIILGPSGSGKTTLLNLLGGMDTPTSGSLVVSGKNIEKLNKKELTLYRRLDVGFVFQFYNLMPNLNALENVEFATEMSKNALDPTKVIEKVGLLGRIKNFPSQLSGGEQQRLSIARALAKNPKVLLCDEPTGALDYVTGKNILKLLHEMCREEKKTVIIVTHNSALKDMADKVIKIKNGMIESIDINPNPKDIQDIEW